MIAETVAESPITVLPEEMMIEILSRVESSNPLQLRCVCKFWNSLVLHPQFMKKHFQISITNIANQFFKTVKEMHAFDSHFIPNPSVPKEKEDGDDEEEEEGEAADDEEEVEDEASSMNAVVRLENLLLIVPPLKEEDGEGVVKQWIRREVIAFDYFLVIIRILKGKFEAFSDDVQTLEDRVKCLQCFLQFYLKSPSSSFSH